MGRLPCFMQKTSPYSYVEGIDLDLCVVEGSIIFLLVTATHGLVIIRIICVDFVDI